MDRGRKILANDCFQELGSLHGLGASRITEKIDIGREAGGVVGKMSRSRFAVLVSASGGCSSRFRFRGSTSDAKQACFERSMILTVNSLWFSGATGFEAAIGLKEAIR